MNSLKIVLVLVVVFVGGWFLVSNQPNIDENKSETKDQAKLSITTSFYPLQFALEKIIGDLGTVTNIGAGKDPHDFEPTTQNILTLQKSDLVVLQGADFETWGDDIITQLEQDNIPVALATDNITLHERSDNHTEHGDEHEDGIEKDEHDEAHKEEHNHGKFDPHTWLDPVLFSQTVKNITSKVIELDPKNKDIYQKNSELLLVELAKIDTEYKDRLTNCKIDEVITTHNSFSYVAERYGFTVHSISGLSTQDTPSLTVLAELKDEAKEGIGAILLEENNIKAYGETLAKETNLKTLSINPIAYMVPAGDNYLTLMQKNLNTFVEALQCNE